MPENNPSYPDQTPQQADFDYLFLKLTGIHPDKATKNDDGWLFIPPETGFAQQDGDKRGALGKLAGGKWKNNLVDNQYAGWWIQRP